MSDDITTGESGFANSDTPKTDAATVKIEFTDNSNPIDTQMVHAEEKRAIERELAEANKEITRYAEGVNIYAEQLAELEEKNNQLQWQINADSECIERVTRNGVAAELKLAESEAANARLRNALEYYASAPWCERPGNWSSTDYAKRATDALATNAGKSALEAVRGVQKFLGWIVEHAYYDDFGKIDADSEDIHLPCLRETFGPGGSEG